MQLEQKQNHTEMYIQESQKSLDFSKWYSHIISESELIEYSDVSGCYILRPWAYSIWEQIQSYMNEKLKEMGVQNAYFPLFVSEEALNKEKDHLEGFAPEVAWVTHAGNSKLERKIAVRPTSETIMYPVFSRWIRSHRDLPLKLNQWANVVRWEFKDPMPFIRSREFLWQEGHTAYATKEEADKEVYDILELYRSVYEELLAVPVIKGIKTDHEKFAGADYTTTVEAFIPFAGKGIQAGTSHSLGQNFSKIFNINFEDGCEHKLVWQNSWGLTTRSIGIMIMTHSDDKGLVLPPNVAPIQVVIVPIYKKGEEKTVVDTAYCLLAQLKKGKIRVELDDSTIHTPGWKYNYWEKKGVPMRLEIGSRDIEKQEVVLVSRLGKRTSTTWFDLVSKVQLRLDEFQKELFEKATVIKKLCTNKTTNWNDFVCLINTLNICLVPFCLEKECEEHIKLKFLDATKKELESLDIVRQIELKSKLTGSIKSLCIPLEQEEMLDQYKCIGCENKAKKWCLFGRSY